MTVLADREAPQPLIDGARKSRRLGRGYAIALVVGVAYLVVFFVVPVGASVVASFRTDTGWTLGNYGAVLADGYYLSVLANTLRIGVVSTVLTILVSYPVAAFLGRLTNRTVALLMIFVILPYFTNTVVRTFAWMVILGTEGLANTALLAIGLVDTPVKLLYNEVGVMIGLVYVFLPLGILIQFAVIRQIDGNVLRAAETMGASRLVVFLKVYLPLSLPGVVAASLLIFIETAGSYITPALMGDQQQAMVAQIIAQEVRSGRDYGSSAALVVVMAVAVSAVYLLYDRLTGMTRRFEDHS